MLFCLEHNILNPKSWEIPSGFGTKNIQKIQINQIKIPDPRIDPKSFGPGSQTPDRTWIWIPIASRNITRRACSKYLMKGILCQRKYLSWSTSVFKLLKHNSTALKLPRQSILNFLSIKFRSVSFCFVSSWEVAAVVSTIIIALVLWETLDHTVVGNITGS